MVQSINRLAVITVLMADRDLCPNGDDMRAFAFLPDKDALKSFCEETTETLRDIVEDNEPDSSLDITPLTTGRESVDYDRVRKVTIVRPEVRDTHVYLDTKRGRGRLEGDGPKVWGFWLRISASLGPEKGSREARRDDGVVEPERVQD